LTHGGRTSLLRPLESLEDRTVPVSAIIAAGADVGGGPRVALIDRATGTITHDFFAYDASFLGGVRVATADMNGDTAADVVTAPGPGGGSRVKVFDGKTGSLIREFNAFESGFLGGLTVAVGDVNADKTADIVLGAEAGGGPRVAVYDGKTNAVLRDFFAYAPTFLGGVRVAAADVTGDGAADVVVGAGVGGGPHVQVFDGKTGAVGSSFFAYDAGFNGGVWVAAADLTADGKAEVVTGAGFGGGPDVRIFNGNTGETLSAFMAYGDGFRGGVRVAAYALDGTGRPAVVTAPGIGGGTEIRIFNTAGGKASSLFSAFESGFLGGAFVAASGLPSGLTPISGGGLGDFFNPNPANGPTLVTLNLDPLNINLLGLQIETSPITVAVSVNTGDGQLLGNLLTVVANLVNLEGVNTALNNVLDNVVSLVNAATLVIDTAVGGGPLSTATASTTPVLDLFVAPVHLDLLGARVDTSPIRLAIRAHAGEGLVLGNVLSAVAHLFDPPLPEQLDLNFINNRLEELLAQLEAALPGLPSAPVSPVTITDNSQVLRLNVPPIDVNLLGLNLKTDEIKVNADAQVGPGELLGNVLTTLLNTLNATPAERERLSNTLNGLLAKVIGVLNATHLVLPAGAVEGLSSVLQMLALPDLVTAEPGAVAPVLNLVIASPDGSTPPVDVDLLGLKITTSNIRAQLLATTGEGQVLGNLVYNVAHLLDPGGSLNLLTILAQLGL
jgi:hypothetical protein